MSHHDCDIEKDEKLHVQITEREHDDHDLPSPAAAPFSFVNGRVFHQPLYPFQQQDIRSFDPNNLKPGVASAFPRNGLFGLLGSICTLFLTFLILRLVDHRVQWGGKITPNSLISGIASLNGFCVSLAFAEGATIAWWFHARKSGTTLRDLHHQWSVGASKKDAALAGRRLNYVALATLFLALLPLNGIVLQSAITIDSTGKELKKQRMVLTPTLTSLPLGFSAALNSDNTTGVILPALATSFANTFGSPDPFSVFNPPADMVSMSNTNCPGICTTTIDAIGLFPHCTTSTMPYDVSDAALVGTSAQILDVSFAWSQRSPNNITMTSVWKNDPSCRGNLTVEQCVLQAAVLSYSIQIHAMVDPYKNPQMQYYFQSPAPEMVQPIGVLDREGETRNTTWGGFADVLNLYLGGSLNVSKTATGWDLHNKGLYTARIASNLAYHAEYLPDYSPDSPINCSIMAGDERSFFATSHSQNNMTVPEYIRASIHQAMLFTAIGASLFNGSETFPNTTTMTTTIWSTENRYAVRWRYWFASIAITFVICLVVAPTFWGYWTLPHKATMSPVDTARAFYAPGLAEVDMRTPAKAMLRELGSRSPHDLAMGRTA